MFRLGLDIDGCINDLGSLLYKYASTFSAEYGINKQVDMSNYSIDNYFGWKEEMGKEFWSRYYRTAMLNTQPQMGAAQTISLLKRNNVGIYLITARKEKYRELTIDWLNKFNIKFDKLIMNKNKLEACEENEIELMVEDEPNNCKAVAERIPVLCMCYRYNEGLEGMNNIERIANWAEIYNEVMSWVRFKEEVNSSLALF